MVLKMNHLLSYICLIVIGSKVFVYKAVNAFQACDAFVLVIYSRRVCLCRPCIELA